MRKRTIVFIAIIGLLCLSPSFAETSEKENFAKAPSELVKSMLKGFSLAPEGTAEETKSEISGHISIWKRFLTTKENDLPLNVSGLSAGRAAEYATVGSYPGVGFGLRGFLGDKSSFDLSGKFYHKDELDYFAGLDLERM
jgi:hypothetical protein